MISTAAYNWIIITMALFVFGFGYASVYDVVDTLHQNAYTDNPHAAYGVNVVWLIWKYLPVLCLISLAIYGFMSSNKSNGGGWS